MNDVSILLCAYNAEAYVGEAIESILCQTYSAFELVLVDDGSTDGTLSIMRSFNDHRVNIIESSHDYIRSLNLGLHNCHGKYIARLDADDLMEPTRIEEQVYFMYHHLDLAACFSWAMAFGDHTGLYGNHVRGWVPMPYFWLLTGNYLMHPTAMIRRSFLQKHRIKYKNYPYAEDFKLWTDIARHGGQFYVIPKPLIRHRLNSAQVSKVHAKEQWQTRLQIQQEVIDHLITTLTHPAKRHIRTLFNQLLILNAANLIQGDKVATFMYNLLNQIRLKGYLQL